MRTTLTIDEHLMKELKAEAHRRGLPLKQVVNRTLQAGIEGSRQTATRRAYKCPTFAMGAAPRLDVNLDKALSLASALEDEESARKQTLRK